MQTNIYHAKEIFFKQIGQLRSLTIKRRCYNAPMFKINKVFYIR